MSDHTLRRLREARDAADAAGGLSDMRAAVSALADALIAERTHESSPLAWPPKLSPHQRGGYLAAMRQMREWHESQLRLPTPEQARAHTTSIAEIDRLVEFVRTQL